MKERDISKYLSLVLRHQPEKLGITLDDAGWTDVEELLVKMEAKGMYINFDLLRQVVDTNDKKRFAFNSDFTRIRASQGHSISIDLGLPPQEPPDYLYHGTAERNLNSILSEGLKKGSRQHVHLSLDTETAIKVGKRHGKPIVLKVNSRQMSQSGQQFFLSENNVWLTAYVAPHYLTVFVADKPEIKL
jgi:putative RNA 2'-phosphotransferase